MTRTSKLRLPGALRNAARLAIAALVLGTAAAPSRPTLAAGPIQLAVLSAQLQNDHAQWVPTTDAERRRLEGIKGTFKSLLEASGKYKILPVDVAIQDRINKDQKLGECAGCELRYGKEVGADQVAWIEVQKVSELILNINVYISDVGTGERTFTKSVDLRGNNDEAWQHSIRFLVKRYLLPVAGN